MTTEADRPLVSIVIPCFNQGRFLSEAVARARTQTYPAVETIVVDDGSTDETAAVARECPGVGYIRQSNAGAPAARNRGLRESRGEFVIFLDADDRLLPHAVATGIEWLQRQPDSAMVSGHVSFIADDGSPAGVPRQDHGDVRSYVDLLRANHIWTPGAVMYRRSALDAVGGFDPSAAASADYELNLRIARRFPIGCHHQVILEYRRHRESMSADAGYMLKSAVTLRRSQRKFIVGGDAERAWREGIEMVQADFGRRLIDQIKGDLRRPARWSRAVRGVRCLLRYYPAGVLDMLRRSSLDDSRRASSS